MITERSYLELCHQAYKAQIQLPIGPGTHVGRGFADLGYEEFLWLPNGQLLSLYTGAQTAFPEGHRDHFFAVPTIDGVIQELSRRGFDVATTEFIDQRQWRILVRSIHDQRVLTAESRNFGEALLQLLVQVGKTADK